MKNKLIRLYLLLILLIPAHILAAQTHKSLHYKEYTFLELPDPPYDGYITSAVWNRSSGSIVFDETSEVGAVAYLNHYFEGTEVVTCDYVFTYIGTYDGYYHAGRGSYTFSFSFVSGTAQLSDEVIKINVGKSKKISCNISTGGYGSPVPEWSSDNENIASVSSDGKITAHSLGETYIRVDPIVCPAMRCHIIVESAIPPTGISVEPNSIVIQEGKTKALTYHLTPESAYSTVKWSSADESIATVSSSGSVTGKKEGKTTVSAKTENGKEATVSVTVTPQPKSVFIDNQVVYIGYAKIIKAVVDPPVETSLTWKINDTSIANIKNGVLTGLKTGKTEITVTTSNKVSAKANIEVLEAPKGMSKDDILAKIALLKGFVSKSKRNLKY